ncbi:hypothetical protein M2244_000411 [Rhodoferax antarcticus]|nr:hypothetical protein [Rhodoferax antarcticus]
MVQNDSMESLLAYCRVSSRICPKDHRRAHYAAERDKIAIQLTEVVDSNCAALAH